jgi:antitoxin (DNA-binding transcriptional repressor) of toxin-antitoxin stability system
MIVEKSLVRGRNMTSRVSVTELLRNFSDILGRVRFRGERFIILRGGRPVAELGPTVEASTVRLRDLPGILSSLPHLDPEDVEQFAADLQSLREAVGTISAGSWGS